ncbi:single-stranded DNA-binding protein [Pseudohongiella nitratireducens]|uniref:single-stranded DNA-binding protein n=1 Tax=Pseudohongiella nitratireducens TaxID=1768907 RepID=UPI0030EBE921|tara:strand:+ start:261 stop:698 length:438 start_codon:yes stop_codon:yes gene_type:complete
MSGDISKTILIGNTGRDPEIRYMNSGDCVATLAVATSSAWNDKNTGQKQERTEWHRVVFFKEKAENIRDYVKKSTRLYIEGENRTRSWEKDGVKRYTTEVVGHFFRIQPSGSGSSDDYQSEPDPAAADAPATQNPPDNFDDDIPF